MQRITIIGRLGKDAETKSLQSGKQVANFSVAVSEGKGDAQTTTWYDCSIWLGNSKALDNVLPHIRKGGQIYVEGKPSVRTYTTQGGETKAAIQVDVRTVELLGSKQDAQPAAPVSDGAEPQGFQTAGTAQPANGATADMPAGFPGDDDDLPF